MGGYAEFMSKLSRSSGSVHDAFAHSQALLKNEEDITFEKKYYGKIVGARQMLSNIGSDYLMLFIQNDVSILTAGYEAGVKEEEFRPAFEYMYHSWSGGLSMTRANKGKERSLQSAAGAGYSPTGDFAGYGQELGYGMEEEADGGLLDKIPRMGVPKTRKPDMGYRG